MRNGLVEMKNFGQEFFADVKGETFLQESAGVADLITSCLGGRNRKVAEAFVKEGKVGHLVIVQSMEVKLTRFCAQPFDELEKSMLNGQSKFALVYLSVAIPLMILVPLS
jgi:glycerol-3-phosphate dehydrogenase (NAD+)